MFTCVIYQPFFLPEIPVQCSASTSVRLMSQYIRGVLGLLILLIVVSMVDGARFPAFNCEPTWMVVFCL